MSACAFHSTVVALAYDRLCTFEFGCVHEVFGLPRPELNRPWYRFRVCAVEPGPLTAAGELAVRAPCDPALIDEADTVVVPGWRGPGEPVPSAVCAALARVPERGGRLVSICSGVFVLAASGVLDGRRATTHWRYADALARMYPQVRVDPDVLFVEDGPVLTSAGSAAGLDLCLHVVRRDHGAAIANVVARRLVFAPWRDGDQRQFVETPVGSGAGNGRLAELLVWLTRHLHERVGVEDMARRAGMSNRTFQRRFRETVGATPANWLVRQRVAHACRLAETTDLGVEQIATASGFGAVETLRHHFRRLVGTTPSQYRRTFNRVCPPVADRPAEPR